MLKIKENIKPEEFEEIFGNTPFENIKKIKEYVNMHYVPYEQYVSTTNEINKKWEDKIKAKIEELKKYSKEHGYLNMRSEINVLQSLLEKEGE